jgi:hypothetical protein
VDPNSFFSDSDPENFLLSFSDSKTNILTGQFSKERLSLRACICILEPVKQTKKFTIGKDTFCSL